MNSVQHQSESGQVESLVAENSNSFTEAASQQMERLVEDFGRMYRERNEALEEVARAHHDVLFRLAMAAELKDDDTGVHIIRIGFLAEALALLIGQNKPTAMLLRKAAPMHDIGKIGTPDEILKKPGPLSPEERIVMNQHTSVGAELLGRSRIPLFKMAAEVALTHHENWDGSGFPHGLIGESIPLSGRIVAVVDFLDALTMDRCYRVAFDDATALQMMADQRGRKFDPFLVDMAMAHADKLFAVRDHVNQTRSTYADLANSN